MDNPDAAGVRGTPPDGELAAAGVLWEVIPPQGVRLLESRPLGTVRHHDPQTVLGRQPVLLRVGQGPQHRLDERLLERVPHLAVGLVVGDDHQRVVGPQHGGHKFVVGGVGGQHVPPL